jgi:chromosome segregation ATPase
LLISSNQSADLCDKQLEPLVLKNNNTRAQLMSDIFAREQDVQSATEALEHSMEAMHKARHDRENLDLQLRSKSAAEGEKMNPILALVGNAAREKPDMIVELQQKVLSLEREIVRLKTSMVEAQSRIQSSREQMSIMQQTLSMHVSIADPLLKLLGEAVEQRQAATRFAGKVQTMKDGAATLVSRTRELQDAGTAAGGQLTKDAHAHAIMDLCISSLECRLCADTTTDVIAELLSGYGSLQPGWVGSQVAEFNMKQQFPVGLDD